MRKYEDAIGRFVSLDPLWEKYYGWSPYVYSMNNPNVQKKLNVQKIAKIFMMSALP